MAIIKIEINSCRECPHFYRNEYNSTDGFDAIYNWMCGESDKKIRGGVEWHEENKIEIPDWCPIKIKEDEI